MCPECPVFILETGQLKALPSKDLSDFVLELTQK
jgi:hypothetical protein